MENIDFGILFQGIGTMIESGWFLACARVFLILLGFLLIYLGWKGILEPIGHDSNGTRYDSHQLWNINHAGWKSRQSFS